MQKILINICLTGLALIAGPASGEIIYFGPNMILSSQSTLSFELAGTNVLTDYDCINAQRQVSLSGTLSVSLVSGFNPQAGDTFNILDFKPNMLTGSFQNINLPALTGELLWDTSALYTNGELKVYEPCHLTADLTGDCQVNMADFGIFAKSWLASRGQPNWNNLCDLATPVNEIIDMADLAVLVGEWLK